jgi:hypothetical protein
MRRFVFFIILSYVSLLHTQPLPFPYNLDFEIGEIGRLPKGWIVPSYAEKLGYSAHLTDDKPKSGKYCLELTKEGKYEEGIYGSVMQSVDAKPYRGKRIRFRAYIRAEIHSPLGSAHIWVRERIGNDEESGFFEYLPNQPMVLRDWELREIQGLISPNADVINFGLLLFGNGKAWIDSASFEIIQDKENQVEKITPDSVLLNELVDLSNVYGVVRYFSPLSEFDFNWECFLKNSIHYLLEHRELTISKKIHSLFAEFLKNAIQENSDFDSSGYISWLHFGVPNNEPHPFLYSKKVNILTPLRKYQGIVQQTINVRDFQKGEFRFTVFVKGKLTDYASRIALAVRFDNAGNKQVGFALKEFQSVSEENWRKIELIDNIPDSAVYAKPALILVGEGNIFFDDASFTIEKNSNNNLLQNEGFEQSKDSLLVFNWRLLDVSSKSGYYAFVTKNERRSGDKALNLYSDQENRIILPRPKETSSITLSDNSVVEIPISISYKALRTNLIDKSKFENIDCNFSLADKVSQIAILIDLWVYLAHFNQYIALDGANKNDFLRYLLEKCIRSNTQDEFLGLLENLISNVKDDFARVLQKDKIQDKTFPFLWKYLNGKLYITKVTNGVVGAEAGDEVVGINNCPVEEFIDSVSTFIAYSTKNWKYLKTLAYIRNNLKGDSLILTLKKNGKVVNVTFVRKVYTNEIYEERPDRFQFLGERAAYFDLTRLSDKELKDVLDTLKFNGYFIFDLRGLVTTSEQFLSLFTDKMLEYNTWKLPVFTHPFKQNVSWQIIKCRIAGKQIFDPKKVYFLIDERTIGVGEVIADLAKTNKIGMLVGEKTGGNPMEMVSKIFPGGVAFYYGIFRVFSCNGREIYKNGVEPNIPVKINPNTLELQQDLILQKVLSLINSN